VPAHERAERAEHWADVTHGWRAGKIDQRQCTT
jgi:hypothetical protein